MKWGVLKYILLALFFVFLYYIRKDHFEKLSKACCYTYGTVTNIYSGQRGPLLTVDYYFIVKGDTIKKWTSYDPNKVTLEIGDTFTVKFSEEDPVTSEIYFHK